MKKNKGQVALIVLVISAVVMTIGMSISKKSVIETKITTDEELLKQAFNAAESGIDYYMGTGTTKYIASDNQSQADITAKDIGGGGITTTTGSISLRNLEEFTWLVGHDGTGAIDYAQKFMGTGVTMCVDSTFDGSLKVDYFYRDSANNYGVKRSGFNLVTDNRVTGYTNVAAVVACPGVAGMRAISLDLPINPATITPLLIAVKPIGDDTRITQVGIGGSFPNQAIQISSVGRAGNVSAGAAAQTNVNQNVTIVNQYQLPGFMMDAVTATGNIFSN